MAASTLDTITPDEFNRRLDVGNERLRQELEAAQTRVQQIEALVARKEAFTQRLAQVLTEIEREEAEITVLEKGLRPPRASVRRRSSLPHASL